MNHTHLRFCAAIGRFCRPGPARARNATRLWNWADHQANPEPYWAQLQRAAPDLFAGASPNTLAFTYAPRRAA